MFRTDTATVTDAILLFEFRVTLAALSFSVLDLDTFARDTLGEEASFYLGLKKLFFITQCSVNNYVCNH